MKREDIEKWTREAGGFDATPEFLAKFASLVAEQEREKCARVCEELETCSDAEFYGHEFSAAIRARKSQ